MSNYGNAQTDIIVKEAVAAERERCAKIADHGADIVDTLAPINADDETARAIIQKGRDNMKRVAAGIAKRIRANG